MSLEKRNILDLIGKSRYNYHSCIITCYSFNFSFFENIVMPTLSIANIRNVNLMIDGNMLEQSLNQTIGQEFSGKSIHKTYSFTPIYQNGAFHPKIMMLFGKEQGLLILGSGNMTSSGVNANDEIWGAFHLKGKASANAPIFGAAWNYIEPYMESTKGFNQQKINWIKTSTPWLENAINKANESIKTIKGYDIHFLGNTNQSSIFKTLQSKLPKDKTLKKLTVISPYFDNKGILLKELVREFAPKKVNCLVDEINGTLPHLLETSKYPYLQFFDWSKCVKDFKDGNRLHAKAYHFQYENEQFLLLGSPNASWQAFGLNDKAPINAEAALLLHSTSKSNLLSELEIKIPKKSEALKSIPSPENYQDQSKNNGILRFHLNKILYAELNADHQLTIYLREKSTTAIILQTFDNDGFLIENYELDLGKNEYKINVNPSEQIHKVALTDVSEQIVSNYMLIHNLSMQQKCNPDQKQQRLDDLIQRGKVVGGELEELLSYITFSDENEKIKTGISAKAKSKNTEEPVTNVPVVTKEDLEGKSYELLQNQSQRNWNTPNILLAEVLTELLKGVNYKNNTDEEEDFAESEEEAQRENIEVGGDKVVISTSSLNFKSNNEALDEANAIEKYFNNLNKALFHQLTPFFLKNNLNTKKALPKVSIDLLSNMIVSLKLWYFYNGKHYEVTEDEQTFTYPYFITGELHDEKMSSKNFVTSSISFFLLLATQFENYDKNPYYKEKLKIYRKEATALILFAILNTYWREKEQIHKNIMLLDTVKFIYNQNMDTKRVKELQQAIHELELDARFISNQYNTNKIYFFKDLLPQFMTWSSKFNPLEKRKELFRNTDKELYRGVIIYKSPLGFSQYKKCIGLHIQLSKISFMWTPKIVKRKNKPDKIEWYYNDHLTFYNFTKWKTSIIFD